MLKQLFISLLWPGALSLTWLTFANCPTPFAPNNLNASLNTYQQDIARTLYSRIYSSTAQAAITANLDQGNMQAVTAEAVSMGNLLPYIIIAAVFFLIFCATSCCCIFERRCPPCDSWRRNYLRNPYSSLELRATMIFAVLFVVGILITTIIVFSSFGTFRKDTSTAKCALYYALDVTIHGDQTNQWGGFSQVKHRSRRCRNNLAT